MTELPLVTVPWEEIFDDALVNDLKSVKRHIEEEHFPLNQTNLNQETVAHIAAKEKNLVMIKYLLGKEPNLLHKRDKWDQSVLTVAIDVGAIDIVRYLVDDLKADIYHPHNLRFGNMAIHIAAEAGQLEVLKYLVEEKGVDVNILNFLREPSVFLAAEKAHLRVLKYLVEKAHANVTVLDSNDDNILYVTAMKGDLKITKYLLDEKKIPFDVNYQDRFGRTILYVASRFNQLPFIRYCVEEKGADIEITNNRGWSPLFEATFVGHTGVMKYLLEKGADIDRKDRGNQTLEMVANEARVTEFLNKTRHERSQRTRRSVPKPLRLMYFANYYRSNSIPAHKRIRSDMSASRFENRLPENISPAPFQNLLAVADTIMRYARGRFSQQRQETLLSPGELMRLRMDEIAVDAIRNPPVLRN